MQKSDISTFNYISIVHRSYTNLSVLQSSARLFTLTMGIETGSNGVSAQRQIETRLFINGKVTLRLTTLCELANIEIIISSLNPRTRRPSSSSHPRLLRLLPTVGCSNSSKASVAINKSFSSFSRGGQP